MAERFLSIRRDPSRQRINTAGKRPIRMHAATSLAEEAAIAIFLRPENGTACLSMVFDELCRRDAEKPG
jgi:hypothetical protein